MTATSDPISQVNGFNFGYDPKLLIAKMPLDRVVQIHVAGHAYETQENGSSFVLDTHGEPVCDAVYSLLQWTLERTGPVPILLERDDDIPSSATGRSGSA